MKLNKAKDAKVKEKVQNKDTKEPVKKAKEKKDESNRNRK